MLQRKNEEFSLKQEMIWSAMLHIAFFSYGFMHTLLPRQEHPILVAVEIAGAGELNQLIDAHQKEYDEIEKKLKQENVPEPVQEEILKEQTPDDANNTPIPKAKEQKKKQPTSKKKKKKRNKKAMMQAIKKANAKKNLYEKIQKIAEAKKKKENEEFDKMLNESVNNLKKSEPPKKTGQGTGTADAGSGNGSVTEGDVETISSQIYPHWAVPSGVKDAENYVIDIKVNLKDNGEVIPSSVEILDQQRYKSDHIFRAAADSARRAILEASPLNIPHDKIDMFREFIFKFNVKEALGG